ILPLLVVDVTLMPVTDTALSLPAEEMVTSLFITYSASAEKSWGTEVDWLIVPAKATTGVNISKAGNIFPRVFVVLFNLNILLRIYTSI
ncbi:TPA: hypothetical protein ACNZ7M_005125, partial [Enterobacter kobei]